MYIYPCKTGGKCQQIMFEEMGLAWSDTYPKNGTINFYADSDLLGPQSVFKGSYKCCTKCHLPLNQIEANRANSYKGYKLEDEKFDEDFLGVLDEF